MKALGLVVLDKKICILKTYFITLWPTYATYHNCLNNIGGSGIIPVEFSQIPISSLGEEYVQSFPYTIWGKIVTPEAGSILTPGA